MMLTTKAVTALLYAVTGAPAHPANAAAGLARLDKLLRPRGVDIERPDAAAILVRYADRAATPESTWAALLALAPAKANEPPVPPAPVAQDAPKGKPRTKAPAVADSAPKAAQAATDAGRYRLPAPGTKYRLALDLMRRPGGATNREICAATRIDASWAVDGRRWAERYGLSFIRTEEKGPKGIRQARYKLIGGLPDEPPPDIATTA